MSKGGVRVLKSPVEFRLEEGGSITGYQCAPGLPNPYVIHLFCAFAGSRLVRFLQDNSQLGFLACPDINSWGRRCLLGTLVWCLCWPLHMGDRIENNRWGKKKKKLLSTSPFPRRVWWQETVSSHLFRSRKTFHPAGWCRLHGIKIFHQKLKCSRDPCLLRCWHIEEIFFLLNDHTARSPWLSCLITVQISLPLKEPLISVQFHLKCQNDKVKATVCNFFYFFRHRQNKKIISRAHLSTLVWVWALKHP